jgi:hypothetical protein
VSPWQWSAYWTPEAYTPRTEPRRAGDLVLRVEMTVNGRLYGLENTIASWVPPPSFIPDSIKKDVFIFLQGSSEFQAISEHDDFASARDRLTILFAVRIVRLIVGDSVPEIRYV